MLGQKPEVVISADKVAPENSLKITSQGDDTEMEVAFTKEGKSMDLITSLNSYVLTMAADTIDLSVSIYTFKDHARRTKKCGAVVCFYCKRSIQTRLKMIDAAVISNTRKKSSKF